LKDAPKMYRLESELVEELEAVLASSGNPFPKMAIAFEFNYQEGKVDVVASNGCGELFSFEAKLTRWRTAVHQAYRNTSFSHYSYVVLPAYAAKSALRSRHEFERRGIGLCSISDNGMTIEITASKRTPLLPWLTDSAMEYISR
jgi:predicted RecB family endonuclease